MRRILFIAFILALVLTGCSKTDFGVKLTPVDKIYDRGDSVPVTFTLENFSFQAGYAIVSVDNIKSAHLRTLNYTIPNITDGYKIVSVELFYDDGSSTGVKDTTKVTVTSPDSKVKFIKPLDGDILNDTTVDVELSTESFGEQSTNKGELQLVVDGKTTPVTGNTARLMLDWKEYDLTAQIVSDNVTKARSTIHIRIKPESLTTGNEPNLSIWFPTEGFNVKGDLISVSVKLQNFNLGTPGTERKANEGYLRFVLDGEVRLDNVTKASKTLSGMTPGSHTLIVQLMQNDGTPYGVERRVTFNAQTVTSNDKENAV